eukprot:TRINITY_DN77082_c0_g1_i1.p1 TRINITY_DN77082_c0_g1~~TRINITY_DN77082_c0_g1_i1.p1  ORF type:complete len:209 (-),score=62.11 TRINITY_DN77082_c0_g1_i1:9-635(-)
MRLPFCLLLLACVTGAEHKTPLVYWGQKPDRLYISVPLKDITEPDIQTEERRLTFKCISNGQNYEVDLPFLRGINVSSSKREISSIGIQFELMKLRDEPCWKRLLKTKKPVPYLKKDSKRMYADDCHEKMMQWREAYFYAKLHPEEAAKMASESEDEDRPKPEKEREIKMKDYEERLEALRLKAVPRKPKSKSAKDKGKNKKKKKTEL